MRKSENSQDRESAVGQGKKKTNPKSKIVYVNKTMRNKVNNGHLKGVKRVALKKLKENPYVLTFISLWNLLSSVYPYSPKY